MTFVYQNTSCLTYHVQIFRKCQVCQALLIYEDHLSLSSWFYSFMLIMYANEAKHLKNKDPLYQSGYRTRGYHVT